MVAAALRSATGDLLLGGHRRWTGTGDWLLREMMSSSAVSMRCSVVALVLVTGGSRHHDESNTVQEVDLDHATRPGWSR